MFLLIYLRNDDARTEMAGMSVSVLVCVLVLLQYSFSFNFAFSLSFCLYIIISVCILCTPALGGSIYVSVHVAMVQFEYDFRNLH